MERFVYTK